MQLAPVPAVTNGHQPPLVTLAPSTFQVSIRIARPQGPDGPARVAALIEVLREALGLSGDDPTWSDAAATLRAGVDIRPVLSGTQFARFIIARREAAAERSLLWTHVREIPAAGQP